jgi:hypothetical protein
MQHGREMLDFLLLQHARTTLGMGDSERSDPSELCCAQDIRSKWEKLCAEILLHESGDHSQA